MKKTLVAHPFLLTVFPILFLFSYNIAEVPIDQLWPALAIALGFSAFLFLLLWFLLKNSAKAGLIVSAFVILFYSYGHIYKLLKKAWLGSFFTNHYLLIFWALLMIVIIYFVARTSASLHDITNVLNVATASLLIISLVNIGSYNLETSDIWKELDIDAKVNDPVAITPSQRAKLPDIYYIILDSYPNQKTLEEIYGFDNSEFTNYLEKKGFFIATDSRSNYVQTYLSLASSLNMEYINYVSEKVGQKTKSKAVPILMIKNNKVARFLKKRGYKFIHFRSGWSGTDRNEFADLQVRYDNISEFMMMLLETSALMPLEKRFGFAKSEARKRILSIFANLAELPKMKEPTFAFAHMVAPHPPYFFGARGEPVKRTRYKLYGMVWTERDKYINQLIFVNGKVETMVDKILADSPVDPIIIIQADHGPASSIYIDKDGGWRNPTDKQLIERTGILNAYYLPKNKRSKLRPDISPVNSFRFIFNNYFGADFKILKDNIYYSNYQTPYKFTNINDRLLFN